MFSPEFCKDNQDRCFVCRDPNDRFDFKYPTRGSSWVELYEGLPIGPGYSLFADLTIKRLFLHEICFFDVSGGMKLKSSKDICVQCKMLDFTTPVTKIYSFQSGNFIVICSHCRFSFLGPDYSFSSSIDFPLAV